LVELLASGEATRIFRGMVEFQSKADRHLSLVPSDWSRDRACRGVGQHGLPGCLERHAALHL
jgi:hypothetical protein